MFQWLCLASYTPVEVVDFCTSLCKPYCIQVGHMTIQIATAFCADIGYICLSASLSHAVHVDSTPSLGVYYFFVVDSFCLSVCMSCFSFNLLLFCFSMESSHFLAVSSPCGTLQNCFLRFLIWAPNTQNLLPKIRTCTKLPISWLAW